MPALQRQLLGRFTVAAHNTQVCAERAYADRLAVQPGGPGLTNLFNSEDGNRTQATSIVCWTCSDRTRRAKANQSLALRRSSSSMTTIHPAVR